MTACAASSRSSGSGSGRSRRRRCCARWPRPSRIAGRTTSAPTPTTRCSWRRCGSPSSTCAAGISRSSAAAATSPASTTARRTTAASCAPRSSRAATRSRMGATATLLPHLYEEHGAAMVERLRGMFALRAVGRARRARSCSRAIGSASSRSTTRRTRDFLIVASEVKAIFASGLVERAIDRDALDDLFSLGYPCPPRTMFRRRRRAAPGAPGDRARARRPRGAAALLARAVSAARRAPARRATRCSRASSARSCGDAVRTHLVADVPLAAALSGGLDSSAIAALAEEVTGRAPATFSITFDDRALRRVAPRARDEPVARRAARTRCAPRATRRRFCPR